MLGPGFGWASFCWVALEDESGSVLNVTATLLIFNAALPLACLGICGYAYFVVWASLRVPIHGSSFETNAATLVLQNSLRYILAYFLTWGVFAIWVVSNYCSGSNHSHEEAFDHVVPSIVVWAGALFSLVWLVNHRAHIAAAKREPAGGAATNEYEPLPSSLEGTCASEGFTTLTPESSRGTACLPNPQGDREDEISLDSRTSSLAYFYPSSSWQAGLKAHGARSSVQEQLLRATECATLEPTKPDHGGEKTGAPARLRVSTR